MIDVRGLLFVIVISDLLLGTLFWAQRGISGPGQWRRLWIAAKFGQAIGFALIGLRGPIPESISIVTGNPTMVLGFALEAAAALEFLRRQSWKRVLPYLYVAGMATFLSAYASGARPEIRAATLGLIIGTFLAFALIAFVMRWRSLTTLGRTICIIDIVAFVALMISIAVLADSKGIVLFSNSTALAAALLTLYLFTLASGVGFLLVTNEVAELESRLGREELSRAQRVAGIGSATANLITGEISWSQELYRLLGMDRKRSDASLALFLDRVHPDDRAGLLARRAENERGEPGEPIVFRIIRTDGALRWMHREVEIVRDRNGLPMNLTAVFQDITDRRRMEEDLRRSHEGLLHAQRMGKIGSAEVDLRTGRATWSEGMLQIYGIGADAVPANYEAYLALVHPDDIEMERAHRKLIERGETVPPIEYRIVRSDGELRWILIETELRVDADGVPQSLFTIHQDVTEHKHIEGELRAGRDRMAEVLAALDIARNAVILLDDKFGITYANDAAFDILGLPADIGALIGKRLIELQAGYAPFLDLVATTRTMIQSGGEWRGNVPWKRPKDGQTLILDHRVHRLPNAGYVLVATDATERLRLEEEDRRHREREAQAGKIEALGNLAGGIAHDFNNLLGAILGFAQFLTQDLTSGSDQRKYADRIVAASERGRSLVRQILAFSRREAIEATEVRLREIVAEAHDMLRATLPTTTQIVLENAVQDATIFIDKGQLLQVLINLCVNASDALDEKPGTITLSVSAPDRQRSDLLRLPSADGKPDLAVAESWSDADGTGHILAGGIPKGDFISLSVTDTGTGIPREMLATILEPFVTTKPKGKGTGLGLAVVRRIVVDQGGAMVVTTREGQGTRFEIVLPLSAMPTGVPADLSATTASSKIAQSPTGKILIVDDDEAYLSMVETALRRAGHEVESTIDPRVALEKITTDPNRWEVVVTDQTMPHIRGNDLVKAIKTMAPRTICIICTGFSSGLNEEQAKMAGADGYLVKPYNVGDLSALVARLQKTARPTIV